MPSPKSKLSITFLGTGHHRDTHQSILVSAHNKINELAQQPDSPLAAWLIDGPGCEGTDENPTPGTYFYQHGQKIADPALAKEKLRQFQHGLKQTYRLVTGEGIESSILEATTYIQEIIDQNEGELPTEVNLQGFSRGADSCVRLANIIYLLYPEIKVNLFLVDPVPGPGRQDDPESYYMPPNVNNCQITLMLDEHRPFYNPQHEERYIFTNPNTEVSFHYMAGRHGAGLATRENSVIMPRITQTLVQDSLLKFNIETGILPKDAVNEHWHKITVHSNCTPQKYAEPRGPLSKGERFSLLSSALQTHKKLAIRPIVKAYLKRRIHTHRENYVLDSDLFINAEHRLLFKELYPAIFNWFFEKNILLSNQKKPYSKENVLAELRLLREKSDNDATGFYDALLAKFKISSVNGLQNIPEPQGIQRIEDSDFHRSLVHDELSYLQFCLNLIVSEYHYRVPSTWFGNWFPGKEDALYKNSQSDKIESDIRAAIQKSKRLPQDEAKELLKKIILRIKAQPKQDFFFRQVSKIIPDSKQYVKSVAKVLNRYKELLPPEYTDLLDKTLRLIQSQMKHTLKDDYQKREQVQNYLVSLSTAIHKLNTKLFSKNVLCEELLDNLNQLSRPSYTEELTIDGIIRDLESYRRRHTFLSYFPFSQTLGIYNPENIKLTDDMLSKLLQIKYSKSASANLSKVETVLKDASLKYAQSHKKEEAQSHFIFWKKHVSFKANPLNKIIENHLKKVTHISSLIFSIPQAYGVTAEQEYSRQDKNFK